MKNLHLFDALAKPETLDDPYPFYSWLREHHPVHLDPDGTVYISRYEYAVLLKDPALRDAPVDDTRSYTLRTLNQALIKAVPPRHTQLRRAGAVAFDRRLLARAGNQARETAERLARQLADTLARDGRADLHTAYTLPLTQRTAAAVFGIPARDFDLLAALPARMFGALYPHATPAGVADADEASRTLFAYLANAVHHRGFTRGSGFARLVDARGSLPPDEVVRLCWMLWWGSYTSALAAIDLAVLTLIERPGTITLLHRDTRAWVEEALRYRSPHIINSANLTTRHEMSIGTTTVEAHTPVRFLLAAMNRDEAAFPQADTFDPHRTGTRHHIAFGEGIHSCIGAQLARMEIATALTVLATHLPRLALAGPPTWRPYTTQRLCHSFPVAPATRTTDD
ncbi:cytochrome P450 [Streptomyces sp. NBC_01166]|uniref:cytochrome P450 n=1 Tax=Streptomyces sp. NBC_01166 TaxID=2903755 RepID=UPI0038671F56|nr:cytochrome P450 [Streptomyces sp. NBC_01166]